MCRNSYTTFTPVQYLTLAIGTGRHSSFPEHFLERFRLGDCRLCLCVIARAQCCTTDAASILLRSARSRSITKQVIQTVMFCLATFNVLNSKLREIMDSNPRPLP